MKLKSFSGGQASRAEVYGLFLASIVLVGGGIGGAYAITNTIIQNDSSQAGAVASNTPTPSDTAVGSPTPSSTTSADSNSGTSGTSSESGGSTITVPHEAPAPPPFVDTRIQAPYIGPTGTFSYLSRNYICGWDTAALGGFGWGYDPAEPCNEEFVAYIGQHCEAGDRVVYFQRCDEYFSHTLPVNY